MPAGFFSGGFSAGFGGSKARGLAGAGAVLEGTGAAAVGLARGFWLLFGGVGAGAAAAAASGAGAGATVGLEATDCVWPEDAGVEVLVPLFERGLPAGEELPPGALGGGTATGWGAAVAGEDFGGVCAAS